MKLSPEAWLKLVKVSSRRACNPESGTHLGIQSNANSWRQRNKYDQANQRVLLIALGGVTVNSFTYNITHTLCIPCSFLPKILIYLEISRIQWSCSYADIQRTIMLSACSAWSGMPCAFINHPAKLPQFPFHVHNILEVAPRSQRRVKGCQNFRCDGRQSTASLVCPYLNWKALSKA